MPNPTTPPPTTPLRSDRPTRTLPTGHGRRAHWGRREPRASTPGQRAQNQHLRQLADFPGVREPRVLVLHGEACSERSRRMHVVHEANARMLHPARSLCLPVVREESRQHTC